MLVVGLHNSPLGGMVTVGGAELAKATGASVMFFFVFFCVC